ncbi:hypothetical protein GYB22_12115 [bacterium]|nr:hypothetical protein [bacterium]
MINPFKIIPVYIQLFENKAVITRLDTREKIYSNSGLKFSNERLIIADFLNAEKTLKETLKRLIPNSFAIFPHLKVVIQQMEKTEGGLSSVEKRVLKEVCERNGAKYAITVEGNEALSIEQALEHLKY